MDGNKSFVALPVFFFLCVWGGGVKEVRNKKVVEAGYLCLYGGRSVFGFL